MGEPNFLFLAYWFYINFIICFPFFFARKCQSALPVKLYILFSHAMYPMIPVNSNVRWHSSYVHCSMYVLQVDLIHANLVIPTTHCLFTLRIPPYASL